MDKLITTKNKLALEALDYIIDTITAGSPVADCSKEDKVIRSTLHFCAESRAEAQKALHHVVLYGSGFVSVGKDSKLVCVPHNELGGE